MSGKNSIDNTYTASSFKKKLNCSTGFLRIVYYCPVIHFSTDSSIVFLNAPTIQDGLVSPQKVPQNYCRNICRFN